MDQRLPSGWSQGEREFYVSITGLRAKGLLGFLSFIRHAIPSKVQAESAPGVLHVSVKRVNGIQHTLTAWESEAHMRRFVYSGPHKQAIRVFRKIATGKTLGYVTRVLPLWSEVHEIWRTQGREY